MLVDRRRFLATSAATAALTAAPLRARAAGGLYVSAAATDPAGDGHLAFRLVGLEASGAIRFDLPLPARGHAAAWHPAAGHCVLMARRPGHYAVVFDPRAGRVVHRLENRPGRTFCGHAQFAADGRLLLTTEDDRQSDRGIIGLRDVANGYAWVGEWPSHGIGPHQLLLAPDGRRLIVANGGILTDPARQKLNLDSMAPNIVVLDAASGALLAQYALPRELHQLGLRHLALARDGTLAVACQYEGPAADAPPLVGLLHASAGAWDRIELAPAPARVQRRLNNYAGGLCFDRSGALLAVSHPRGSRVTFWRTATGAYLGALRLTDACGLAAAARGGFLVTGGTGAVVHAALPAGRIKTAPVAEPAGLMWDNHLLAIA
jgi:hypothetical protein